VSGEWYKKATRTVATHYSPLITHHSPITTMGQLRLPPSVLLIVAAFGRYEEALRWAEEKLPASFGPIARSSPDFVFNQTEYYEASMGAGLRKRFLVFHDLVAAEQLADIKLRTNELEQEVIQAGKWSESRPLNLDPGILSLGKFMLATTKDQSHRIYLRDGIYAEVTLRFQDHAFHPWPWTYADYREPPVLAFLGEARDYYRQRLPSRVAAGDSPGRVAQAPGGGSPFDD
jgi:hypothetical protein